MSNLKFAIVGVVVAVAAVLAGYGLAHASSCSFSRDLTIGSRGIDVTCLQQSLLSGGYSIPAGATGYFGVQTQAAVSAWQSHSNVSPAAGYFGPLSRAAFATGQTSTPTSSVPGCIVGALFSSTTGAACTTSVSTVPGCVAGALFSSTTGQSCSATSVPTTTLTGSGRLTAVSSLGDVESDLKESDSATSVVGVSADAIGGDVAIQRVDATFTISNGANSSNLNKYVSDVSLYLDGKKLASMDPASGTKDGRVWTVRFSGLTGVIKSGQTGNLYVKVTPVASISSNEDGKTVTASIPADSVRAVSADGISDTYVGTAVNEDFTVSSVTTGLLTITAASDNPVAGQVTVGSSTTSGVPLLSFNAKAKNQDIIVTDLVVSLTTSDNHLNDVISNVKLMSGSTVLSSKTVGTATTSVVTFTNIDKTITKDSTTNFKVVAELKGDNAYTDGTTISASTVVVGWDVSDADGATVAPSAVAAGNDMTLTSVGVSVTKGSVTTAVQSGLVGSGDTAQFVIPFTVTAGDDDVYIGSSVAFSTTNSSTLGAVGAATTNFSAANVVTGDTVGSFKVLAGTSRTFTFNASYTAVAPGFTGVILTGINYGPTGSLGSVYTSGLDTFKTSDVFMTVH